MQLYTDHITYDVILYRELKRSIKVILLVLYCIHSTELRFKKAIPANKFNLIYKSLISYFTIFREIRFHSYKISIKVLPQAMGQMLVKQENETNNHDKILVC